MNVIEDIIIAPARELPRPEIRAIRAAAGLSGSTRWTQLRHGYYLRNQPGKDKYQTERIVSLARIAAEAKLNDDAVFTLESAALLHGYATRDEVPPVCLAKKPGENRHTRTYPAVTLGEHHIPAVTTQTSASIFRPETMNIEGIETLTPVELICIMLRKRDPVSAMITVDHACARLCAADPIRRQETNAKFAKLQKVVRQRLQKMRGQRGYKRALRLVELMTPWSHSPLETRFRLIAAAYGFPTPILQYEVLNEGARFYVDAYFPRERLAVELDGLAKYNNNIDVVRQEKRRERHLLDQRMQIERFSFRELVRPELVAQTLARRIPGHTPAVVADWGLLENW